MWLHFDNWKKWFLEFPGNLHCFKRLFLRKGLVLTQILCNVAMTGQAEWRMKAPSFNSPCHCKIDSSRELGKERIRMIFREYWKCRKTSFEMLPSLLMLILHILTCFILYNKPTCPYFHLQKYQPDLTNHSWEQICTKIQLDWWTRCNKIKEHNCLVKGSVSTWYGVVRFLRLLSAPNLTSLT